MGPPSKPDGLGGSREGDPIGGGDRVRREERLEEEEEESRGYDRGWRGRIG